MAKTNKELAVEIWSAMLQATATIAASPNFQGEATMPSPEKAVSEISLLEKLLSQIEDK